MAEATTLRRVLSTALKSIGTSTPGAVSAGGVAERLPLPSLRLTSGRAIPLALNHGSVDTLREIGTPSGTYSSLSASRFEVSSVWDKAIADLANRHLTEMELHGIQVEVKRRDLLVITGTTTISPTSGTTELRTPFASMFVQLPADNGGTKFVIQHGEHKSHQEYDWKQNSEALFYAVTFLSECDITLQGSENNVAFLRYDVYLDGGPLPSSNGSTSNRWALKRAAYLWREMQTKDESTAKKFAVLLNHRDEKLSFDKLQGDDAKVVDFLRSAQEYTMFLVQTSKPKPTQGYYGELIVGGTGQDEIQSISSPIRTRNWLDDGSDSSVYWFTESEITASEMLLFNSELIPYSFWERRVVLVFWPRAHDSIIARRTAPAITVRIAKNAARCGGPDSSTTINSILANFPFDDAKDLDLAQLLEIAADIENFEACKNLLNRAYYGLSSESFISGLRRVILTFGWEGVTKEIVRIIENNGPFSLIRAASLACTLLFEDSLSDAAEAICRILIKKLQITKEQLTGNSNSSDGRILHSQPECYGHLTKLMFSLDGLDDELDNFSSAASYLTGDDLMHIVESMQKATIKYKHRNYQHRFVQAFFTNPPAYSDSFLSTSVTLVREMGWTSVRTSVLRGFDPSNAFHLSEYPMLVHLLFTDSTTHIAAIDIGDNIIRRYEHSALSQGGQFEMPSSFVQMLCMYRELEGARKALVSSISKLNPHRLGEIVRRAASVSEDNPDSSFLQNLVEMYASRLKEIDDDFKQLSQIWRKLIKAQNISSAIVRCLSDAAVADSRPELLDALTSIQFIAYAGNGEFHRLVRVRVRQIEDNRLPARRKPINVSYELKDVHATDSRVAEFLRSSTTKLVLEMFNSKFLPPNLLALFLRTSTDKHFVHRYR